jgi:hypothetical protein
MNIDPRLRFLLRRVEEVRAERFGETPVRVLDVGCADGSFMSIAGGGISRLERIDGLDVPSAWARSEARQFGAVHMQNLQEGTGDVPVGTYHIATLWEVIEHIPNGYAFLANLRKLLVPEGVILLSTPNLLSLSRFVKGAKWVGISEQDHKYLFDPLTLPMLLERAGFHRPDVRAFFLPSMGPALDGVNKVISAVPGGGMFFAKAFASPLESPEARG